jgi:hypothetical protein
MHSAFSTQPLTVPGEARKSLKHGEEKKALPRIARMNADKKYRVLE